MRLSTKLLLISEFVLVLLVFLLLFPVREQMLSQVAIDLKNELRAIAATAALQIDGDLHAQLAEHNDPDSDAFVKLRDTIERIRVANGLSPDNIYTFYIGDDQTLHFGVMTQEPFVGHAYKALDHHAMAVTNGRAVASGLYSDEFGQWISAAAPIYDSNGKVVGLLEVNRKADAYFRRATSAVTLVTTIALSGLAVSSVLGYFILRRLVIKPVHAIHTGMIALGNGNFDHRVNLNTQDELQELGNTLNNLVKQLSVARTIQANFFPKELPHSDNYRFAARTDPCDATGGDYIDAFAIDDETVLILVADVSGHGLGPSLIMASCRSALHALARTGIGPAELLDSVEQQIAPDLTEGRFITMIVGLLKPDGTFTYANAGHSPAMVVKAGEVIHLTSNRPPLGIMFPVDDPPETTIRLDPGDRIVITSDGVSEAQDHEHAQFGQDRIVEIVSNNHADAEAIVTRLQQAIDQHVGAQPINDDVTLLCVDRV